MTVSLYISHKRPISSPFLNASVEANSPSFRLSKPVSSADKPSVMSLIKYRVTTTVIITKLKMIKSFKSSERASSNKIGKLATKLINPVNNGSFLLIDRFINIQRHVYPNVYRGLVGSSRILSPL